MFTNIYIYFCIFILLNFTIIALNIRWLLAWKGLHSILIACDFLLLQTYLYVQTVCLKIPFIFTHTEQSSSFWFIFCDDNRIYVGKKNSVSITNLSAREEQYCTLQYVNSILCHTSRLFNDKLLISKCNKMQYFT